MIDRNWQRSSFSGGGGNNCVECTATGTATVALRESEVPAGVIRAGRGALGALLAGIKAGRVGPHDFATDRD
ncbi:DUF397 domain-containing protein [Streptoverticillium reticulum]|uniref:DUF397 domain-containing protein n=1 Tax=Streptoverticillium reticulum TaxID=1433415 RepID=UPI0039BEEB09